LSVFGIIPAAGYGTRLKNRTCSKEVFPIGGRPVMDYLVERMLQVPDARLRVVTRPEKEDVIARARDHGAEVIEAYPESLGASVFAGTAGLDDEDIGMIGFPDSVWDPVDAYVRTLALLDQGWDVALGLLRAPDMRREEPVITDDSGRVLRMEFKPENPSADHTWATAAAPIRVLRGLEDEPEPGIYFNRLAQDGRVGAIYMSGEFLDMGTVRGLELTRAAVGEPGGAQRGSNDRSG
jgi:NDP-sugar pyrophosphorylase family protein